MGFMSTPKPPGPDPELVKKRKAEEERLAKQKAEDDRRQADMERKQRQNLLGARSLQNEELEGFGGYRRRNLGQSIRS